LPIALLVPALLLSGKDVQAQTRGKYKVSVERYVIPDVTLVNQDGVRVKLGTLLNSKKVTMVDFFYTTCPTVCPVVTAVLFNFQNKIGPESDRVQLVSISIDPENDTPERVKEYLKRYNAKLGWQGLTGTKDQIEKAARALNAYTADKMTILPLIQLYSSVDNRWVRISGFIGTSALIAEYEKVLKP
jgi:protein SCO1/2